VELSGERMGLKVVSIVRVLCHNEGWFWFFIFFFYFFAILNIVLDFEIVSCA